jgi:protoporphyrinogen oxidase
MTKKIAIIAGAGPAGLTAAYELKKRTDIIPIVFEATDAIGGISRTHNYKGNRMDIGGHRFYTKVDRVMNWWFSILPRQGHPASDTQEKQQRIDYAVEAVVERLLADDTNAGPPHAADEEANDRETTAGRERRARFIRTTTDAPDPEVDDEVMLERARFSRIFYRNVFFSYPLVFTVSVAWKLGILNSLLILLSYIKAQAFPFKDESTLDKFVINRFGERLFNIFFKEYTEKVWGVPCNVIKSDWGAQRIKGLSLKNALTHAIKDLISQNFKDSLVDRETSLINTFFYPKLGPGQMWETVADRVRSVGGQIHLNHSISGLHVENGKVVSATVKNNQTGIEEALACDYFFSTMPIKHLVNMITPSVPENVREIGDGLCYRDFITVGLLMKKLNIIEQHGAGIAGQLLTKIRGINASDSAPDNWIYIQDGRVKVGRVQIFNNWSPYLVADRKNTIWLGLEYFVQKDDWLWAKPDEEMIAFGIKEMEEIKFLNQADVLDACVLRMPNTYPAYFGSYGRIHEIYEYANTIDNLFLIGRNGLHKYNNQDHSMMTAMLAVDMLEQGETDKRVIFDYNIERVYQEERATDSSLN